MSAAILPDATAPDAESARPALPPRRLRRAGFARIQGHRVPIAASAMARLLGLALLDRDRAGTGLLLPRCRSIHTFGMRFELDLLFLDANGALLAVHRSVGRRRIVTEPRASAVLELPARAGGRWHR